MASFGAEVAILSSRTPFLAPLLEALPQNSAGDRDAAFPSTRWSVLAPGSAAGASERANALELLAQCYAEPIRAFLRQALRRDGGAAEDITQDFFVWMIESAFLNKVDARRGSFRAFLKTALRHYVQDRDRRERAQKRGGAHRIESLDHDSSRREQQPAASDARTDPDQALDEAWRTELIQGALGDIEAQLREQDRSRVFEVFRAYFLDPAPEVDYQAIATRFAIKLTDVSNDLVRAKQLFRAALQRRVRETVSSPIDQQAELVWLFGEPK